MENLSNNQNFFQKIKLNIFSFYYSITSEILYIQTIYIVILTIDFIQKILLIHFDLTFSIKVPPKYQEQGSDIVKILPFFSKVIKIHPSDKLIVTSWIIYCFFSLTLIQIIVSMTKYKIPYPLFKKIFFCFFLFLQILYQNYLTIPIMSTLLSVFQCSQHLNNNNKYMLHYLNDAVLCNSKNHMILIAFSSFTIIFYLFICILNCFLLHNSNPKSNAPFAGVHFDRKIFDLCLKVSLSFFFIFDPLKPKIKGIFVMIFSALSFAMRLLKNDFYSTSTRVFSIVYDSALLYHSCASLIEKFGIYDYTIRDLLIHLMTSIFFGVFILLIFIKFNGKHMMQALIGHERIKVYTALKLYDIASKFKTSKLKRNVFMSLLEKHVLQCYNPNCNCMTYITKLMKIYDNSYAQIASSLRINIKKKTEKLVIDGNETNEMLETEDGNFKRSSSTTIKDENHEESSSEVNITIDTSYNKKQSLILSTLADNEELSEDDCLYGFIKMLIESSLANMSDFFLVIFLCYIMKNNLHNYFRSMFEIMKLKKKERNFSEQFIIYCLQMDLEEELFIEYGAKEDHDLDIENVLEYNDDITQMIDKMTDTTSSMKIFWSIVTCLKFKKEKTRKTDLYSCGIKITENISTLNNIYIKISHNKSFTNYMIRYLYSLFLYTVLGDSQKSKKVDEEAQKEGKTSLNDSRSISTEEEENDASSIFRAMDNIGIIIISGRITSTGKILSINHQACSILNYEKEELIQDNISKIVPSFIGQYHDEFIHRYLETAKKHIINKIRVVFAQTKDGLLVPTFIYVKVIPNLTNSVRFIGMIKELDKNHPFLKPNIGGAHLEKIEVYENKCCFLLVTSNGEIFGTNELGVKYFGLPLNLLKVTNEKRENAITLDMLFPMTNFYEKEIAKKLRSNEGSILTLDCHCVKHLFNDYKESVSENIKSKRLSEIIFNMNQNEVFKEHMVLCYVYDLCFNEGKVPAKIIKVVKIKPLKNQLNIKVNGIKLNDRTLNISENASVISEAISNKKFLRSIKADSQKNQSIDISSNGLLMLNGSSESGSEDIRQLNHRYFTMLKKKIISQTIHHSIKILMFAISTFLLLLLCFSIAEFSLSKSAKTKIINFLTLDMNTARRTIYFSAILMYFKTLVVLDNNLLDTQEITREDVIKKISHDLNIVISINYDIAREFNMLVSELRFRNHTLSLSSLENGRMIQLNENFTITRSEEKNEYIMNAILIKIQKLIMRNSLSIDNVNDLFFFNEFIQPKSKIASSLLLEIFFVNVNGFETTRLYFEGVVNLIQSVVDDIKKVFSLRTRIYVCIPPFILLIICIFVFYFIFKSIAKYKIRILRIFYLIERKFGVEMINNCIKFNSILEKRVQGIALINDNLTNVAENNDINTINTMLNTEEESFIGPSAFTEPKWIQFWIYDSMDENLSNKIKEKKNYISYELFKSKKRFWKTICLIYAKFMFLLIVIVIYFSVSIYLDIFFERSGLKERVVFRDFTTRGWNFNNMVSFFRELGFNYKKSTLIYNNFLTKIDEIENNILIMSSREMKNTSSEILYEVLKMENELNTEKFCDLMSIDSSFYLAFQEDCDQFYTQNSGLKDGIKIIIAYFKSNFPQLEYFEKNDLETHKQFLSRNISFVRNTQNYINKGILNEIDIISKSITNYAEHYYHQCIIRITFFCVFIFLEYCIWGYIIYYLVCNLNKDKLILTLIPNNAIGVNRQLLVTLKDLQ